MSYKNIQISLELKFILKESYGRTKAALTNQGINKSYQPDIF